MKNDKDFESLMKVYLTSLQSLKFCKKYLKTKGVARGKGGRKGEIPPPETEKIDVKNGLISEGSIFSNKFSKRNTKYKIKNTIEFSS